MTKPLRILKLKTKCQIRVISLKNRKQLKTEMGKVSIPNLNQYVKKLIWWKTSIEIGNISIPDVIYKLKKTG